jgi:periplasmic protein TonB
MKSACLLLAVASAASSRQPPVAVANSPPPIVAVPHHPGVPGAVVPPELAPPFPPPGPLPPAPNIVRAPQPRASPASLVTPDDYPASARARREQGRVEVTLTVGPNGRAVGCVVTRSSGSSALDSTTCAIMVRRARFTPAVDSNGQPAVGTLDQWLEWRLP